MPYFTETQRDGVYNTIWSNMAARKIEEAIRENAPQAAASAARERELRRSMTGPAWATNLVNGPLWQPRTNEEHYDGRPASFGHPHQAAGSFMPLAGSVDHTEPLGYLYSATGGPMHPNFSLGITVPSERPLQTTGSLVDPALSLSTTLPSEGPLQATSGYWPVPGNPHRLTPPELQYQFTSNFRHSSPGVGIVPYPDDQHQVTGSLDPFASISVTASSARYDQTTGIVIPLSDPLETTASTIDRERNDRSIPHHSIITPPDTSPDQKPRKRGRGRPKGSPNKPKLLGDPKIKKVTNKNVDKGGRSRTEATGSTGTEEAKQPEQPDQPEQPEQPERPEQPEQPEQAITIPSNTPDEQSAVNSMTSYDDVWASFMNEDPDS